MKRALIYSSLMLVSMMGHAQLEVDLDTFSEGVKTSADNQTEKGSKVRNLYKKAKDFADARSVSDVDTFYIQTPKEPWRISVDSYLSQSDLLMKSTIDGAALFYDAVGNLECHPRIKTDMCTSVGVRLGYKGFAVHYAINVAGEKGRDFSLSSAGTWYCAHLRLHEFKTTEPKVRYEGNFINIYEGTTDWQSQTETWTLTSPIKARTVVLDGYYIFNKRRFSYKAAYRQTVIQRRSAGSWLAGAMLYYSDFRFDDVSNADIILYMGDAGRIKQWQANIGAGYGYNFVPAKGWLISAMAMPMLTVYNNVKTYNYNSYYRELALADEEYDPDDVPLEDRWISKMGTDSRNSRISLNFNARLSITYNWKRYFACVNGQFYNFNYRHKDNRGRLNDWYANAAIGMRF